MKKVWLKIGAFFVKGITTGKWEFKFTWKI